MMEEATMCVSCLSRCTILTTVVVQEEPQQGLQVADAATLAKRPYVA